ncbi:MAG: carboxypeptidase regulatory-like domain-containing protein [Candidatus Cryptobacteroides sp.]
MKKRNLFRVFVLAVLAAGSALSAVSCTTDDNGAASSAETAAICGVIKDTYGNTLEDVDVIVRTTDSSKEVVAQTKSDYDGTFAVPVVPSNAGFVTFEKEGFSKVSITVTQEQFKSGAVFLSPILEFASASITGRVLNALENNAPFAGVSVSIGVQSLTTGSDGVYEFNNLTLQDYTLTITKSGCATISKTVKVEDFNEDGQAMIEDIVLGGKEILPGLSAQDLKDTPKWYINEYRGGYGNGGGEKDWSTVFMSAQFQRWVGGWEMQNEGCTLRFKNEPAKAEDVNMDVFDTFTYGSKLITEDNHIMSVNVRCHQASEENPAYWGVQVVDLSEAEPVAVKIGGDNGISKHTNGDYATYDFDLSAYDGKEVIIAIGRYVHHEKEWNQLCISHVSFASARIERDGFLESSGAEEVKTGWHMTKEEVRSMMPNPLAKVIGYTPSGVNIQTKSNPAYKNWAGTGHICSEWGFQYVSKDTEPLAGEGFVYKTRSDVDPSYDIPEAYFYSKLAIAAGHNTVKVHMRNFSGTEPTTFSVAAITMDGEMHFLAPGASSVIDQLNKVDGTDCYEFIHEKGGLDVPDEYGVFVYDLSGFNGQDVVFTLAVHKGATRGGEQKICLHSIEIQ